MMTVFVFAIEIQQAVSNSGNMEFADAIAGLWGFIVFFAIYAVVAGVLYGIFRLVRGKKAGRKLPKRNKKPLTPLAEKNTAYSKAEIKPEPNIDTMDEQNEKPIRTRTETRKRKESIK